MFSIWDIIKIILISPYLLMKMIYFSIRNIKKDREIKKQFKIIFQELDILAVGLNKGPTKIESFYLDNSIFKFFMTLNFLNDDRRITLKLFRDEDEISVLTGGKSGVGTHYYKKKNIDFEKITEDLYRNIEYASLLTKNSSSHINYGEWKQSKIYGIITEYFGEIENKEFVLRRIFILTYHNKEHIKYKKSINELSSLIKENKKLDDVVNEIKECYDAKKTMDKLIG